MRIGPYADRAEAELVRLEATKVRNDVNAQVVTLDATPESAPAATASVAQPVATPAPVQTETLPPAPVVAAPKPEPKPAPQPKPEPPKPVATKPVVPKPAVTAPTPAPVRAPAVPAASSTGFAVQLGAFSQAVDANAMRDRVRAAGFSAFVEQVRTDNGTLNRVRVGPVANRADAEQLKAQVAAKVGVAGMVRPHP